MWFWLVILFVCMLLITYGTRALMVLFVRGTCLCLRVLCRLACIRLRRILLSCRLLICLWVVVSLVRLLVWRCLMVRLLITIGRLIVRVKLVIFSTSLILIALLLRLRLFANRVLMRRLRLRTWRRNILIMLTCGRLLRCTSLWILVCLMRLMVLDVTVCSLLRIIMVCGLLMGPVIWRWLVFLLVELLITRVRLFVLSLLVVRVRLGYGVLVVPIGR